MVLILAAVVPAAFLMVRVYRSDRLEREPVGLLLGLVFFGALSTVPAGIAERLGQGLLSVLPEDASAASRAVFYFCVVGPAEEGFKYLALRLRTWRSPEFNCQYDGVVYAVFVSLGFALWENIGYVLRYGLSVAVTRALTAVPGHACFGVFMGVWYGIAKKYAIYGREDRSALARWLAVLIPAALHGCYDFIATLEAQVFAAVFLAFVLGMYAAALRLVKRLSENDQYIS